VRYIDEILRAPEREERARFFWQQGPEYLTHKLLAAASRGALTEIRALLRLGGRKDIAYTDDGHNPMSVCLSEDSGVYLSGKAMRAAIGRGDVRAVEALLEADVCWAPLARRGEVLCEAALFGEIAICALALKHGADVNCHDGKALSWAVERYRFMGDAETVAFLIEQGARAGRYGRLNVLPL
jgi:hypothetical protein